MSDQSTATPTRSEQLNSFFSRRWRGILVFSVLLVASIIAAVVIAQVLDARNAEAVMQAEAVQELWDEYLSLADNEGDDADDQITAAESELRDAIGTAREEYRGSYADLRASFILGSLEWDLEDWSAARTAYLSVVDGFGDSHLAGPALASAAAASENLGETERARELYGRLAEGEAQPNLEAARAIFNLGRLAEDAGEAELALEYYNRLVDEYASSTWTNLGRNRIIFLTTQGVGSES
mgnify:CR=1 FL=1